MTIIQNPQLEKLVSLLNALYEERDRNGGKFLTTLDGKLKSTKDLSERGGRHIIKTSKGARLYWTHALGRAYQSEEDYGSHSDRTARRRYDLEPSEVKDILWALAVSIAGEPNPEPRPGRVVRAAEVTPEDGGARATYNLAREKRLRDGLRELLLAGRQWLYLTCSSDSNHQPEIEIVQTEDDQGAISAVLLHELTMQTRHLLRRCQASKVGDRTRKCGKFFIATNKKQEHCPGGRCAQRQRTNKYRSNRTDTTA